MNIARHITPVNHSAGRFGARVDKIVLHTMAGSMQPSEDRFFNPRAAVSAHYGVGLSGEVRQWVSEGDTAWANGNWNVNTEAISIEHEDGGNYNDPTRTDALYAASIELCVDICHRYGLNASNIHIHKEFSATGCPDGLDVARIKNGVAARLNGQAPAPVSAPVIDSVIHPLQTKAQVHVTVLRVHRTPDTSDAGNFANTPDGMLHEDDIFVVTGYTEGEDPYGDGRNTWLRSIRGNWIWAGGTDFSKPAAPEPVAVPVSVPEPVVEEAPEPVVETPIVTPEPPKTDTPPVDSVTPVDSPAEIPIVPPAQVKALDDVYIVDVNTGKAVSKITKPKKPFPVFGMLTVNGKSYLRTKAGWIQPYNLVQISGGDTHLDAIPSTLWRLVLKALHLIH